ncbi:phosphohydrolase [Pistricoccus aurantiacus]|uniref:Phosphohydrolase n=1 Tax=Pistricoccus aurantiacus TaxID=1883414 RepID=A0A5B8SVA1_9GAMM|nr:phosphohydrolase [Pistricoccus aurantiacus]QEA38608.1 phosphohydrolase [Pistricoccus aurantiacus]
MKQVGYIVTVTGRHFHLEAPTFDMVAPYDIAHALAQLCRFGGHTRVHYSVAQHSVLASHHVPREHALAALLHDATEAYLGDVVTPLKTLLPLYRHIEAQAWAAICERFGLSEILPASVKRIDLALLATERRDLLVDHGAPWPCLTGVMPLSETIVPWSAEEARQLFLARLDELLMRRRQARKACAA